MRLWLARGTQRFTRRPVASQARVAHGEGGGLRALRRVAPACCLPSSLCRQAMYWLAWILVAVFPLGVPTALALFLRNHRHALFPRNAGLVLKVVKVSQTQAQTLVEPV